MRIGDDHAFAAAQSIFNGSRFVGHGFCQTQDILQGIFRGGVFMEFASADQRGAEIAIMDGNEAMQAAGGVKPFDDFS